MEGAARVLAANEDYWNSAPVIPRIELVHISDNTARAQAFEAGDLDLIQSPLSPQDVRRLSADSRFQRHFASAPALTYFNFNTAREPLTDPPKA